MVWYNDVVTNPELPEPHNYGWDFVGGHFQPVMTSLPPVPDAVPRLVKCSCAQHGVQTMDLTVHTSVTVLMMNRAKIGKTLS